MKKIIRIVLIVLLIFAFSEVPVNTANYSCDWPMPRKDVFNTGYTHDFCRPQCDDLKLQWKFPLGMHDGEVYSPPSVATIDCNGDNNHKTRFGDKDKNGIDDFYQRAYFGTDKGVLFCVNAIRVLSGLVGFLHWKWTDGGMIQAIKGTPAIFDNKVYFGTNRGNFYCLNACTGIIEWVRYDLNAISIEGSAIVSDNGKVYFGTENDQLYCLDAYTGWTVSGWPYIIPSGQIHNTPSLGFGCIYFGATDNYVYRISTTFPSINPIRRQVENVKYDFSTSYAQDLVFYNTQRNYCYDQSLFPEYATEIDHTTTGQAVDPGFTCQCKYAPRVYYVTAMDGEKDSRLVCLVKKDQIRAWYPEPRSPYFSVRHSLPSVGGSRVYLTGRNRIFTYNATTGALIATKILRSPELIPISIAYQRLYTACENGVVYCFGCDPGDCFIDRIEIERIDKSCKCICVGDPAKFKVTAYDRYGNIVTINGVEWSLSNDYYGNIDQNGVFDPLNPGEVSIIAEYITEDCHLVDVFEVTICSEDYPN